MRGSLATVLCVVMLLLTTAVGARAATAFFYSAPDNYYGWAAGYGYNRAEQEAEAHCRTSGSDCRFAVECAGGWSAAAFSDETADGMAIVCGGDDAKSVRITALALCMQATHAMCWTSSTIDANGNEISDARNDAFDTAYLAQQMLFGLGFLTGSDSTDGNVGPRTRQAIAAFEAKIGLPADGELTLDLLWRLVNVVGGPNAAGKGLYAALAEPHLAELKDHMFVDVDSAAPDRSYSEDLADYPDDARTRGWATMLAYWGYPCSIPAASATPVPPDGKGGWHVVCAEGSYTVLLSGTGRVVGMGLRRISVDGDTVSMGDLEEDSAAPPAATPATLPGPPSRADKPPR